MQSRTSSVTAARPRNPMMDDLRRIRNVYTDYTLVCNGQEFKVHRLILHLQSTIFAAAFAGPFKEGQTSIDQEDRKTVIKDIEPEIVQAMLDWFYTSYYDLPEGASKLVFHLKVYALADYYGAAGLTSASLRHFQIECEGNTWTVSDLTQAVTYLEQRQGMVGYERLKDILLAAMKTDLKTLLGSAEFGDLLSEFKELNVELLSLMVAQPAQRTIPPATTPSHDAFAELAASPLPVAQRGRGNGGPGRGGGRGRGSWSGGGGW